MVAAQLEPLPYTLAELSAMTDDVAGRPLGLDAAVRCLAAAAPVNTRLTKAREALRPHKARLWDAGHVDLASQWYLTEVVRPATIERKVTSAAVQRRAGMNVWESCKVEVPKMQVWAPDHLAEHFAAEAEVAVRGIAIVPPSTVKIDPETLVTLYEQVRGGIDDVTVQREAARGVLLDAIECTAWDGGAVLTADGWKFQTWVRQFRSTRCAEVAPEWFERLAVDVTTDELRYVRMDRRKQKRIDRNGQDANRPLLILDEWDEMEPFEGD